MIHVMLGALLLAGCAAAPPRAPAPTGPDAAAIVIEVDLRLPIQEWRSSPDAVATIVYFVRPCADAAIPCVEPLVPSNYASNGRVYLLNAEPGEYKPVAAAYETSYYYVVGSSQGVSIAYLPDSLARDSSVRVQPGHLSDAGRYRVNATFGVCPDAADPGQLRYAELMEPGTNALDRARKDLDASGWHFVDRQGNLAPCCPR